MKRVSRASLLVHWKHPQEGAWRAPPRTAVHLYPAGQFALDVEHVIQIWDFDATLAEHAEDLHTVPGRVAEHL